MFSLLGNDFAQIFCQIVFTRLKALSNTNLEALWQIESCSLPAYVRHWKPPLLELPNVSWFRFVTHSSTVMHSDFLARSRSSRAWSKGETHVGINANAIRGKMFKRVITLALPSQPWTMLTANQQVTKAQWTLVHTFLSQQTTFSEPNKRTLWKSSP